nr:hypothetical protein [Tanacetum cinerariifolium]
RLRIGRSNFRLPSDIQSKESTLQVVYAVLRRSPFFKAFLVTADVHEIYMQEFWATTPVHQHSIRFKMDTRKNIVDLESFREMLHISPRVPGQSFAELPFEEEILEFLRFLDIVLRLRHLLIATSPADPSDVERIEAEQLKIQSGSSTDEGTGSRPGVPDVPSDDSEEEISSNSFDDEDVDDQTKGSDDNEGEKTDESDDDDQDEAEKVNDDDDDEEEISKIDEQEATESDGEDDGDGEEDQGLRISEEERMHKEEKADELYRDVDINHVFNFMKI